MLRISAALAAIIIGLTGCTAENLFVTHRTVVGVNASVNADQTKGHLTVGYKRGFFTIAPKSVETDDGIEAMSVLSCSELEVDGIRLSKFVEQLATGKAAQIFAKKLAETDGSANADVIFGCWEKNDNVSKGGG